MMLEEPENFFPGYPPLAMAFFQILHRLLATETCPIDFIMRFEEALHEVKSKPKVFGHVGIFISTMRMAIGQIAEQLFDKDFSAAIETCVQNIREEQ